MAANYVTAKDSAEARVAELEKAIAELSQSRDAARQRIDELEQAAAASAVSPEVEAQHAAVEAEAAALREELAAAKTRADDAATSERALAWELEIARTDLAKLQTALDASKAVASEADELRQLLQAEKDRADQLERRLTEETSRGAKSALALQLAQALKDTEEAQHELESLRSEVSALRNDDGASAQKTGADEARPPALPSAERDGKKQQLGVILLKGGHLTQEQLELALEEQRKSPQRHLGGILVDSGFVSEDVVAQALASQCRVEFIRLTWQNVDAMAANLVTQRLVQLHGCIPIRASGDQLVLAMSNPLDLIAIEDIERASGRVVEPVVATASDVAAAIARVYGVPETVSAG